MLRHNFVGVVNVKIFFWINKIKIYYFIRKKYEYKYLNLLHE